MELENVDVSENVVWGVKDCIGDLYRENIGLESNSLYINAGVLLFNLDKLRKIDIKRSIDQYMTKYERLINYADQDILNGIFKRQIGIVDPKYNVMTIGIVHTYEEIDILRKPTNFYMKCELENAINNPKIIHYTTNMRIVRPWFKNTNHPFAENFRKYMQISPWKNMELTEMYFTSKEAKIIGIIMKLPNRLAYAILGLMHSKIKPLAIRIRAQRSK